MNDVFGDPNYKKLRDAAKVMEFPDFVKEASAAEDQNFEDLPSSAFAHPAKRMYPVNTKSNAWLSGMYFQMDKKAMDVHEADVVEKRLSEAANFWNLRGRKVAAAETTDDSYAIPLKFKGETVHVVEVGDKGDHKEAAEYLKDNKTGFTYDLRRQFAKGLINAPTEKRAELNDELDEYLEKTAGFGMATRDHVGRVLLGRVCLTNKRYPEFSERLVKYANSMPETVTPKFLRKTAEFLDLVDRGASLTRYYGGGIESPEESLFYVTEKTAAEVVDEMVTLSDGRTTNKSRLLREKEAVDSFFSNYYGELPYDDDESMVDVVRSLPRPDAEAFVKTTKLAS